MSFGAGHIADMINRMKQNRALTKKGKFKNNREAINAKNQSYQNPKFKKVSEEKLNIIKAEIQKEALKEKKRIRKIYITIVIVFIIAFSTLVYVIN